MHWNLALDALPESATIGPLALRLIYMYLTYESAEAQCHRILCGV